jgi:hypothetical protein
MPEITQKSSPLRWKSRTLGGYILISSMDDQYLLNTIGYALTKPGHKHSKLDRLVAEAYKRGLPLPRHRWVILPTLPEGVPQDARAKTVQETPDYFYK